MTEAQIKHMVDRFLAWRLPENFNDHMPQPMKHEPSGTNLFDAMQATAMVRHMIEGMPPGDQKEPAAAMTRCGYCHTWRSKPCGEGCYW